MVRAVSRQQGRGGRGSGWVTFRGQALYVDAFGGQEAEAGIDVLNLGGRERRE